MKLREVKEILSAEVICGQEFLDREATSAFGSDMMSDVLAFAKEQSILLTGLVSPQAIRTALMLDMPCVVFVRAKKMKDEVVSLARESGITILSTEYRLFETCGKLYAKGLKGSGEVDD